MIVRFITGSLATVGLLGLGQCTTPVPPTPPPIATSAPAPIVVTVPAPTTTLRPPPLSTIVVTTTAPATTVAPAPSVLPAPQYSSWPSWRRTNDGVPHYAGRPACTVDQANTIAAAFRAKGASVATAQWAIYVASREGGCNPNAVNVNRATRDNSHCTFQLNARTGGPLSPAGYLGQLGWTPTTVKASLGACARAAADLWARCGKGPWIHGDYSCRRPQS